MNNEGWTMNNERWTMNNERWTMNDERWTMNDERWTMNDERWTINNEQTNDEQAINNELTKTTTTTTIRMIFKKTINSPPLSPCQATTKYLGMPLVLP